MRALLLFAAALAGCTIPPDPVEGGPIDISDLTFGEFSTWARPIEDYIDFQTDDLGHDSFDRSIQALHVFGGRLYLGYGDATLNLGRTFPIEARFFYNLDPEDWRVEYTVNEEAIGRYRGDAETLLIPGVDATEDAWIGNAYSRHLDTDWIKSRTLDQALHVHDMLKDDDGSFWACGSGGTQDEYNAGQISSLVFHSTDDGTTFELAWKVPNTKPSGDARFTSLTRVDGALHAFGYRADGTGSINQIIAYRDVGADVPEPWSAMTDVLVDDVVELPDGRALATGVFVAGDLFHTVRLLDGDDADEVAAFEDLAVLDFFELGDGRVVTLALGSSEYPIPAGPYEVEVGLWDAADGSYRTLRRQESATLPLSVAYWKHSLFVGIADGRIRLAEGEIIE